MIPTGVRKDLAQVDNNYDLKSDPYNGFAYSEKTKHILAECGIEEKEEYEVSEVLKVFLWRMENEHPLDLGVEAIEGFKRCVENIEAKEELFQRVHEMALKLQSGLEKQEAVIKQIEKDAMPWPLKVIRSIRSRFGRQDHS